MIIRAMRTGHVEDPLGFEMAAPVFTWVTDQCGGARQKEARMQVSLRADFERCLYDSGPRSDISGLGFAPELALSPRTRYYWRVQVTADNGETALSEPAWFETGKQQEPWAAEWIAAPFDADVHPAFTRSFHLPGHIAAARVYAVGLGLYELSVNGQAAGDEVLAPFFHDYSGWLQYQTFDVTELLMPGENRLEVWLGKGWYMGRFGFYPGLDRIYGERMQLLLEMRVQLADGREIVIGSGPDWQCCPSPVLSSSIYDGEIYDARREGMAPTAFAQLAAAPSAPVEARRSVPLRKIEARPAAALIHTPAGEQVLDFGQIITGWVEFDCRLPEGARLRLQYGEVLQDGCFYRDNLRSARAEFEYISSGRPAHARPHFTFYGFRYVKVSGLDEVRKEDFTAWVIHSDLAFTGRISTSNPKLDRLFANALWSQRGNFLDVPTDCPQRDERMGWTGDAHIFAPTASFNMYTPAFFDKYLYDMLKAQKLLNGSVPHVVPDVLSQVERCLGFPGSGFPCQHGSSVWGDAAIGIPWTLYRFYGDRGMLKRHYENMRLWTEYIRAQDDGRRLWLTGFHFGDWLALDNPIPGSCYGGTDAGYVASVYYFLAARTTARAAEALEIADDAREYERLAREIKTAIQTEFFTATGRLAVPTQTARLLALATGIAPEAARPKLIEDIREKMGWRGNHLDTGFVGTYYLLGTLCDHGMADLAYTLLLNEDYPSWLYEVDLGATTIWERWNSLLPDGRVSDTGMNSLNHYAYGSVAEWMYRYMAGLDPAAPGFRRARIAPVPDARLNAVRAEYDSASGRYVSAWQHESGRWTFHVEVPFDCEAEFIPPFAGSWRVDGKAKASSSFPLMPGKHELLFQNETT